MDIRHGFFAALLATAGIAVPSPALPQAVEVQRFGLYVLTTDIDRSKVFYEALFAKAPQVRTPALVGFDVEGGLFAVVDRKSFAIETPPGSSVRPYIRVRDIDAAFLHVKALAPGRLEQDRVVNEGPFRFFRFSDPDGNIVEFFSIR